MSQAQPSMDAALAARLLGVEPDCGEDALKAAFRAAVKHAHPDRPGGDAARLRALIEAYERLRARPPAPPTSTLPPPPPILKISPLEALSGARRAITLSDGAQRVARLPAGLRAGDRVRMDGQVLTIAIAGDGAFAVIGDHLCVTLDVDTALARQGGQVRVETPRGPRTVRISRQDALRGLARLTGEGLPARGKRPAGDLLVRLRVAAAAAFETPAQVKRRRFTAAWAA